MLISCHLLSSLLFTGAHERECGRRRLQHGRPNRKTGANEDSEQEAASAMAARKMAASRKAQRTMAARRDGMAGKRRSAKGE